MPNPKNRNQHSEEQIERLCKIIQYQGFRTPLIISNQSGQLVAGHGRLEAAKKLGMINLPVIFEDFENSDQEYAANVSDNSIGAWAELDLAGINADLADLGPFDIDLLGLKDFRVDSAELNDPDQEGGEPGYKQQYGVMVVCESELQQEQIFYKLTNEGLECRVVVT